MMASDSPSQTMSPSRVTSNRRPWSAQTARTLPLGRLRTSPRWLLKVSFGSMKDQTSSMVPASAMAAYSAARAILRRDLVAALSLD